MSTLCPTFVRVKMRVCLSDGSVKTITFWGQKLGPRHYRKVNAEGEWGNDNTDNRFIGVPVEEKAADLSRKYGTLQLLKAGQEFVP